MNLHLEVVKKHWPLLTGGLVGLLILYYIVKHAGRGSTAGTGAADAVQSYSAQADLQNAQTNAQVEIASIQGSVASQQVAAQLKATEVTTAAQLAATQQQTAATETVQLAQTEAAVRTTAIQADALTKIVTNTNSTKVALAKVQTAPILASLANVNSQLFAMFKGSKHFSSDISAFAPVIALETGQGGAAPGLAQADAQKKATASATASAVGGFFGNLLSGVFA